MTDTRYEAAGFILKFAWTLKKLDLYSGPVSGTKAGGINAPSIMVHQWIFMLGKPSTF